MPERVFYEGSDSAFHDFIVNEFDRWYYMKIPRDQINITDIRPGPTRDSTKWYYCVDPCDQWRRSDTCRLHLKHRRH